MTLISVTTVLALSASSATAAIMVSFADVVQRASPGVVNIRTTSYVRGRAAWIDPYQFFLEGRQPKTQSTHSLGSGIIMNRKGHILTNYHVIKDATSIEILFAKRKRKIRAKVIGMDAKTDIALLQAKLPKGVSPVDLGNSDRLRVGDIVLAIGNPFGYAHTVTSGIISAKGRVIGTGPYDDFLQTDAAIHPGNSGGPLIDTRGRVVGINSAVASEAHGIGFAIPINMAKSVVGDLLKHGKVIRPWFGLVGKNILSADEVGDQYDPAGIYGIIVANLIIDGPAHKAGLKTGDLILGMNGKRIRDMNQLQRRLRSMKPGKTISLRAYRREKKFFKVTIRLEETPATKDLPHEKDLF